MSEKGSSAAPSSFSQPALPLPSVFGRLILLKLLARGGMGDVYLAATTGIEGAERPCIVKTVRRDHIHDGSFLARFLDEARVQAQLNHSGVAQVLEAANDENGEPYTVVEYVEGRSLADVRQRAVQVGTRIGWAEACAIAIDMGMALAHVHERSGADGSPLGIVHRDLSPQNVMVGFSGEVKLIDFGTARGHNRRCHTVAGVVFAKPGYVAPEVARQQVGDGRIDVYALGIMLWELVAGKRFLTTEPHRHLEDAAAGRVVVPPVAKAAGAPEELDLVIQKLTANEPDERYASAHAAALDLGKVLAQAEPGKNGERSVRARISTLMKALWPHEPARSRADFAKLLKQARGLRKETHTPPASGILERAAERMKDDDPTAVAGTPYRVLRTIGEGSSGVVYEAEHVELGRKVALKVLGATNSSAKDAIERFRREARAIAKLSHPNLVQLYDFGKSLDGRVFLAMELLAGETLERRLKDTRGMDWREAVALAIEVTRALEAAHGAGVVHRDLKPQNLFLTEDNGLKLLDFGVAMALADVASEAREKRQKGFAIFGTPEYMSPEQVAGEAVDGRCDLYALGCVLYELATGTRPFEGSSSVVVMGKQLRETPEPPRVRETARGIPSTLDALIMKALSKAPSERFASATEMREALEQLIAEPQRRGARATRMTRAGLALSAALAAAVAFVAARSATRHEPTSVEASAGSAHKESLTPTEPAAPSSPAAPAATGPDPITAAALQAAHDDLAVSPTLDALPEAPRVQNSPGDGRPPEAHASRTDRLNDARRLAKGHMSDARALRGWAHAAYRAGELREARRAAEVWSLHDGTSEPRVFLATVLDASGRREAAKAVLEEWLQLHPDSDSARAMHARLGAPIPSDAKKQIARR
jgi:serine/threonine-protein kinase